MVYNANLTWPNANLAPVRPKVIWEHNLFKIHHRKKYHLQQNVDAERIFQALQIRNALGDMYETFNL